MDSTTAETYSKIEIDMSTTDNKADNTNNNNIINISNNKPEAREEETSELKDLATTKIDNNEPIKSNLTLYKKQVFIESNTVDGEKSYLNYKPNKLPFSNYYTIKELVYECMLAPTKVYIGEEVETGAQVAIKEIVKTKLNINKDKDFFFEFIYNEMAISKYLSSICHSVVHAHDYFETNDSFIIVMELCDRPNFFEELLENVS